MNSRDTTDLDLSWSRPVIAIMNSDTVELAQMQALLSGFGWESEVFSTPASLLVECARECRFSMLVLSFDGSSRAAEQYLQQLCFVAGAQVSVMLLMRLDQVELCTGLMNSEHADFILRPFREEELLICLLRLHFKRRTLSSYGIDW